MGHNGLYNFDTTLGSIIFSTGGVGGEAGGAVNYNGLIYIIRQSDDMRMQSVECRDPFTGGIKWSRSNQNEYFAGYDFRLRTSTETGTGGNFEMTVPCIAEDTVFIQFMGEIHAMDSRTGVSKWKINLGEFFSIGINGLLHNAYGYTGSVAYENGKIYCAGLKGKSPDTMSMYCLDAKKGQEVWRYEVYTAFDEHIMADTVLNRNISSPIVSNGVVYFGAQDGYFYALDAGSGAVKWKYLTEGKFSNYQIPAISGNTIYFGTDKAPEALPVSPLHANGILYGCRIATADHPIIDPNGELVWKYANPDGVAFGSVIIGDGKLIATGYGGYVYVLEPAANIVKDVIQLPRTTFPTIVQSGNNFNIECLSDPGVTVWSAKLSKYSRSVNLTVSTVYNFEKCIWELTAQVPSDTQEGMYNLEVSNSKTGGISANSVKVIKETKSSYYYIHISAPLNNYENLREQINIINPEFVIVTGNITATGSDSDYEVLLNSIKNSDVTVYFVPGDTDCNGESTSAGHLQYENKVGPRYYSFSYGSHKFVGVDTTDDNGMISTDQFNFLQNELNNPAGKMKTIFYFNDNRNQLPSIYSSYDTKLTFSYANKYDGSVGNDGLMKANIIKLKNWHFSLYDNARVKFLMPISETPYTVNNGELANAIDMGNGVNICSVKTSVTAATAIHYFGEKIISIGTTNPAGYSVTYFKDKALTISASIYTLQNGSALPTRIFAPPGRLYFRVFAPDGKIPSFSINQPGTSDYVGQCEPIDGSGFLYSGYYDVNQEDGNKYVDGDAEVLINGISPDIGNIFRIKTRKAKEPVFRFCEYSETGGAHITMGCSSLYVYNYEDLILDFGYELASAADQSCIRIYRKTGNEDWAKVYEGVGGRGTYYGDLTWSDTNIISGVTYKYRFVTVGKMGIESIPSREYEVTAGSLLISDTFQLSGSTTYVSNCGINITNASNSSAVVTWDTNVPSTTQVEYGLVETVTAMCGDVYKNRWLLPEVSDLVTAHCITITGLKADTNYGVRVISKTLDGKVNSFGYMRVWLVAGSKACIYPSFKTLTNTNTVAVISGTAGSYLVLPGDSSVINIAAKDISGNLVTFPWATSFNFSVIAGDGNVSPTAVTNSYSTNFTTSTIAGVNTAKAIKTAATPMTTTINITSVNPHHYKVSAATVSTVTAGVPFEIKITAYSVPEEIDANILPLTMTNKNITLTVVDPGNTSIQLSDLYYSAVLLSSGVKTLPVVYNKAEITGIKIKAVDPLGNTGISELFTLVANSGKKWTVNLTASKATAVTGEIITLTGKILDFYGNKVKEANQTISLTRLEGDVVLSAYSMVTDATGEAQVTLTMGTAVSNVIEGSLGTLQKSTVYVKANTATTINILPQLTVIKVGAKTDIQIEAKDAGGNPVAGVEIGTSVVSGAGTLNVNMATTNSSGIANCVYFGNTVPALNSVKAEILGAGISNIANINTITGDLDHYKVDGPASAVVVNAQFSVTVSAMDKYNNLVSVNNGIGLVGTMSGYPASLGKGVLSVITANLSNGLTTITNETYDKADQIQVKAYDSNGIFGYGSSINVVSGTNVASVDSDFRLGQYYNISKTSKGAVVSLVVFVKDAGENPVSGAVVTFSVNKGSFSSAALTSDVNGKVKNNYTVGEGICTATITSGAAAKQITIEGVVPAEIYVEEGNTIIANFKGTCFADITIKDAGGTAIPNGVLSYAKTSGSSLTSISPTSPVVSDSNGKTALTFMVSAADAGNVVRLTAGTVNYDVTVKRMDNSLLFNAGNSRGLVGTSVDAVAALSDSNYYDVAGALITFQVLPGSGTLSISSGVTSSTGKVTTKLTLGQNEELNTVSANYSGVITKCNIKSIKVGRITGEAVSILSTNSTCNINFTVYGTDGIAVSGAIVTISKAGNLGVTTVTTTGSGVAAVVYTAGSAVENVTISGTNGVVTGSVVIKVIKPAVIELSCNPGIVLISSGSSEIKAVLKDIDGYPIANSMVTFNLVSGTGGFAGNTTASTDGFGVVKITFMNITLAGNNAVNVSCETVTNQITVKSIDTLTGCKMKLTVPSSRPVFTWFTVNEGRDIFVQIVNSNNESVGAGGTVITLTAATGNFQYMTSAGDVKTLTSFALTTDAKGKAAVTKDNSNISDLWGGLDFYPVAGNNILIASAPGFNSVSGIIISGSTMPCSIKLRAEPSAIKPSSMCKITASITRGGLPVEYESVSLGIVWPAAGSLSATNKLTDNNGEAVFMLYSTSSAINDYVLSARYFNPDLGVYIDVPLTIPTARATVEGFGVEVTDACLVDQPFTMKITALDISGGAAALTSPVNVTISAVLASDGVTPGSGTLGLANVTIQNNMTSSINLTNISYTAAEKIKIKVEGCGKTSLSSMISYTKASSQIGLISTPARCIAGQAVVLQGMIKDVDGRGVNNQTVSLVSSGGILSANSGISDIDGAFDVMLTTPSIMGTTVITAVSGNLTATCSVTTTSVIASYTVSAPLSSDSNGFQLTITAKDSSGNVVVSSPTVTLNLNTGTGVLGVTSVRLSDGVAVLTETYSKAENGVKITAADGNGKSGTCAAINITNNMPQVLSLVPAFVSNITGGTIQITGKNFFGGTASNNVTNIKLNDTGSTVLSGYAVTSDTGIVNVIVPPKIKTGSYDVLVTTSKGTSAGGVKLTITTTLPVLSSITPNSCVSGETKTISISGSGFYAGTNSADVRGLKVGSTAITTAYTVASDTSITGVIIPGTFASGTYNVVATTGGGDSAGVPYIVNAYIPVPIVANITLSGGYRHSANTLNISGNGYFGGASSNNVTSLQLVGTSTVTITAYNVASDVLIQNVIVPVGIAGGTYNLKVTTTGGTSLTNANTNYVALVDVTAPTVLTVTANVSQVKVTFSEDVTLSTVTNKANYTIQSPTGTGNKNLSSATITYSGNMVTIGNLSLTADATFTTTVSNVTDLAGNTIVGSSASGIVQGTDLTAPTNCTVVINGGAGFTGSTNVTLTLSATDANAGMGAGAEMQFSNTGTTWVTYAYAATSTWTLATGTGTATVYAKFSDALGNWTSSSVTNMIVLDTTGPTNCSIVINNGDSYTNNTTVALAVYAEDADSGVSEMQFMNETGSWSTPEAYAVTKSWNITGGDGVKTVNVRYKDNAGNWSEIISGTITLDTTGPVGSIDINSGAIYTKSTIVTLNLSATDHYSGVNQMQFKEGIGSWSVLESYVTGTKILTVTNTDELKTISVRYTDNLNNISLYSKDIKLCTVTKLEVLSQTEMVAGENIAVTVRAVREEGVNSVLVTGYLNKVGFNVKDANAAALPDYTFAGTDSGIKQVFSNLKTLGEQEIEVTDKEIDGITGKVKIKVYAAIAADGTSGTIITNTDGTSVEIPAGAFSGNRQIGFSVTDHPRIAGVGYRYKETVKPISRDFGELNKTTSPWQLTGMTFSTPVKISVPYKQEEIGDVDENSLRLFYYDESSGKYIIVPGKQIISGGKITAQVNHFSTYRVLGTYVSSNLNNVIAYPNPYRPNAGADGKLKKITLPIDCTATIYNIAGEKVREIKEADEGNLGWIDWDGKNESSETVSRGVYLYVVIAPDGSRKISKIALIK